MPKASGWAYKKEASGVAPGRVSLDELFNIAHSPNLAYGRAVSSWICFHKNHLVNVFMRHSLYK